MNKIEPGSYVKIPKGTTFYDDYGRNPTVSKRDAVAQVAWIVEPFHFFGEESNTGAQHKTMVQWGTRRADINDVVLTDAPKPVVRKEAGPTLRQRMVKGTEWKLTADAQLMKVVSSKTPGNPYASLALAPGQVLPAGTLIKVTGKFQTYYPRVWEKGLWVPVEANGKKIFVEFKELNKNPEQIAESVIPQFVIWDTEQKKYFTGDYHWRELEYTDRLTKAKKFKRLSDVRAYALLQSGYYDGLPETWGVIPDWMSGGKAFNIPDTWEIVKINKLTKKEIERIELIDTFKRSWRLRELTVKFGSPVRQIYSEFEKKKKLDEFSAIMIFKTKADQWGDVPELTPDQEEAIRKLAIPFGKEVKIQKGKSGFAVAIKDVGTALMVRLAYQGDLDFVLIDFNAMDEIVQGKQGKTVA